MKKTHIRRSKPYGSTAKSDIRLGLRKIKTKWKSTKIKIRDDRHVRLTKIPHTHD